MSNFILVEDQQLYHAEQRHIALNSLLCYVDGAWAYFTTRSLTKQTGDDWNDTPYEHNAGPPHKPSQTHQSWQITKVAWEGPFITPDFDQTNSPYSVDQINQHVIAWLRGATWEDPVPASIYAGVTLQEFIQHLQAAKGKVYMEVAHAAG